MTTPMARAGRRVGSAGSDDGRHRPERPGGPGGDKPGGEEESEPGAERDDEVEGSKDGQGEGQGQASREPPSQDHHRRRAHDHADGEDGDQQAGVPDRNSQILSDLREQARHHELGGAHQECADRQDVHDQRQPAWCGWLGRHGLSALLLAGWVVQAGSGDGDHLVDGVVPTA